MTRILRGAVTLVAAVPESLSSTSSASPAKPPRIHLDYLDGIRGAAALYVTLYHLWQFVITRPDLGVLPTWFKVFNLLQGGHYAVAVFIVLSGYCLMLPVVQSQGGLSGGLKAFVVRRARRILPAYFAAVVLSIVLIALTPLGGRTGTQWDIANPAFTQGSFATHALLVHNLFKPWRWTINPPLWSVALEWQIYFVFALVLLPLFRRAGILLTVAAAFALGMAPVFLGGAYISTWYLGLFALGMAACVNNFSPTAGVQTRQPPAFGWEIATGLLWMASGIILFVKMPFPVWVSDTLVGCATAALLIVNTHTLLGGASGGLVVKFFSSRPLTTLGAFSYSLYLLHFPLLALAYYLLHLRMKPTATFGVLVLIGVPLLLCICYVFYRLFERPFLRQRKA